MGRNIRKTIHTITHKDFRRIHWRKYLTRKVIILTAFGLVGVYTEHVLHLWFLGKGGELAIGTVIEHLLFEIPIEEA